jgi:hypothetical protein
MTDSNSGRKIFGIRVIEDQIATLRVNSLSGCKQATARSMGLICFIKTFCFRLRRMRRAIILESSQESSHVRI